MTFSERIRGAAIAIVILILCFPLAILTTIMTSSFWLWFEHTFGIEAYGHSGPAQWCYLVSYGVVVAISTYIWSWIRKHADKEITPPTD